MKYVQLLAALFLLFTGNRSVAGETTIAVASNFAPAMQAIAGEFEKTWNHKVNLVFGSSGKFYAQIKNGAPFQAFFSADQAKPLALEHEDLVVPGSRFTYAIGALALWSKRSDFTSIDARTLQQGQFRKLALANPVLAPYGMAAVEVLQRLGLDVATESKQVRGENIAQTFQFVESGNADLGFVALSQITYQGILKSGKAWVVPQNLYTPIRQDAALLRRGENSPATHEFLQFFRGQQARRIIESYGYRLETEP
jgi:molybdate transport system substrate-binding protein